ncbi:MAG: Flp pilus assembly protein CpaB [Pseudomonadota bacterium]
MRIVAILFMICGVALAGGAIFYANERFSQMEASMATDRDSGPELVLVLTADQPLHSGMRLDYQSAIKMTRFVWWPKEAAPEGSFATVEEIFGPELDQTRTVLRSMEQNDVIVKSKITGFGERSGVSSQVRDGMRAVTIPIDAVSGTGGHISPGDRVDIQWLRSVANELSSHILLEDVLVVATDQSTDSDRIRAQIARTATVEVSRSDAQHLTVAMRSGTLTLLLRGAGEDAGVGEEATSVSLSELPGAPVVPEPEPVAIPEPVVEEKDDGYRVRVRKGAQVGYQEFQQQTD